MKAKKMVGVIFLICGLIFLGISIIMIPNIFNYDNVVDITGEITDIVSHRDSDGDTSYEVYVKYEVDGEEYTSKMNSYSSSWYEGKIIDIYYDKNNPNKIGNKGTDLLFLMFPGFGLIAVIIGGGLILSIVRSNSQKKRLKQTGIMITANYIRTSVNTLVSVNGVNPYRIECEWYSPEDNKTYRYFSDDLWNDPSNDINNFNIKVFQVYVDPKNKNKYYMDVDQVLSILK